MDDEGVYDPVISLRIPADLLEDLKAQAAEQHRNLSQQVRYLITSALEVNHRRGEH